MSTNEIRNWCTSIVRVHYINPALTQKFPAAVRAFNEADENEDGQLSSSEYRSFAKKMKEVFNAFEKGYDENINGRIDKENPEYFAYTVTVSEEMNLVDEGENLIVDKKAMPTKAIDDIYE